MSIQQILPFEDEVNYTKENVEITGGSAKLSLVPHPGQVFTQLFNSDSGFTYDAAKAEFVGGVVRQKDLRPANGVLAATYSSSKNLSWSASGSLVATDIGTPVLSGGKLQCLGGGNNAVRYENADIGSPGNVGAMKIKYTPNYSGTPATNLTIFEFAPVSGNNDRMLLLHSASGGTLRLTAYTSVGTVKYSAVAFGAAWSPVAGTEYELELNWDTLAGIVRLFVNGVLQGSMTVSSYARGTDADRLYIGAGTVYPAADAEFNDAVLFSTVQHTAGYTPGYSLPETIYSGSSVALPSFAYTGVGTILEVEDSEIVEIGAPRYIVAGRYWDGLQWAISNGTYAQASPSATVIENLTSLNASGATTVPVSIVFDDSNDLSSVDSIEVTVTGERYSPTGFVEPAQAIQVQAFDGYEETSVTDADTNVGIQVKIDGILKYHNGTAWVNSDGSLAQSNTAQEVSDNITTLILGQNSSVFFRWVLSTDVANKTPELQEAVISYDFGGIETLPTTCLVWGYVRDISGAPISGAEVKFQLKRTLTTEYSEAASSIIGKPVTVLTDVNGYFEKNLIRSSEFSPEAVYTISVTKKVDKLRLSTLSSGSLLEFSVPDADNKDMTDLI
jgi:hypothetical protein